MLYRQFTTSEEIDNQYAMSRVIGDTAPYFQHHAETSVAARNDLECELSVHYGPTLDENLDIFPAADPNAPILIFIHGGYWRAFSSQDFSFVARGLVARGVTVVMPNYALCPKVTLPEITRQCRAAAAWVYNNADRVPGDKNRIYVSGHSAGGHLTVRTLTTDWEKDYGLPGDLIKGGYAISGLYDLRPLRYAFVQPLLQLNGDIIEAESPLFHLPDSAAPLITDVGGDESDEFRRQSADFMQAWQASGLAGYYNEEPGTNHFTVIDGLADASSAICNRVCAMMNVD